MNRKMKLRKNKQIIYPIEILKFILYCLSKHQLKMKRGHRRTNSQTIGLARPYHHDLQKIMQKQHNLFDFIYHQQKPIPQYTSIQSLLEKSQTNISQRILYIENLEQPNTVEDTKGEFSFGKGINYKLSSFKLNMGEIPEVPKSNESTSLQGQNKLEARDKETFFVHQTCRMKAPTHCKTVNQLSKPLKFQPKHMKTSSAVGMNKISKFQKVQKPQSKLEIKSVHENQQKENPLKKPKFEYQIPKKPVNFGKEYIHMNPISSRVHKQAYLENFLGNEHKKKKKNFMV